VCDVKFEDELKEKLKLQILNDGKVNSTATKPELSMAKGLFSDPDLALQQLTVAELQKQIGIETEVGKSKSFILTRCAGHKPMASLRNSKILDDFDSCLRLRHLKLSNYHKSWKLETTCRVCAKYSYCKIFYRRGQALTDFKKITSQSEHQSLMNKFNINLIQDRNQVMPPKYFEYPLIFTSFKEH
jgi:hypothetical protein